MNDSGSNPELPRSMSREGTNGPSPIRIAIADDHPVFRDAVGRVLSAEPDFCIVAVARDGPEVLRVIHECEPDVLLLDLMQPASVGLITLQQLQSLKLRTKVIVLTATGEEAVLVQAMRFGTRGIVSKQSPASLLIKSIHKVYAGEIWLDAQITVAVMRDFAAAQSDSLAKVHLKEPCPLSPREREVAALVAQGFKNRDMARKMSISEQTVKNHLHKIFEKLGIADRLGLALYAIHWNINGVVSGDGQEPGTAVNLPRRHAYLDPSIPDSGTGV